MKPSVLFLVTTDPRTSARPAEAIRIAAGLGAWKRTEITLYLRDSAILTLADETHEWVDGDHFQRYWPMIRELGRTIRVQAGAPFLSQLGEPSSPYLEITDRELSRLTAQHTYVARF